jgi:hypothetical protein
MSAIALAAAAAAAPVFAGDKKPGADPDPRIGKEVDRICFQSTINGWRAVKGEDDVVLLERGVNSWYRVELLGACDYRLFRSALAIGIDSSPGGGCVTRGDRIIVEDGPGFERSCVITHMYEWDEDAKVEDEDDGEYEDDAVYEEENDA